MTKALAGAVAALTRHLNWREAARHFHLDWKSVATIVKRAVAYGLARRRRRPLHWIGVDEVSRRKGHRYLIDGDGDVTDVRPEEMAKRPGTALPDVTRLARTRESVCSESKEIGGPGPEVRLDDPGKADTLQGTARQRIIYPAALAGLRHGATSPRNQSRSQQLLPLTCEAHPIAVSWRIESARSPTAARSPCGVFRRIRASRLQNTNGSWLKPK